MDKEKLNWRSFADSGEAGRGPICNQFNLRGTPTLYVLDHKGVIRYKFLGSPGENVIDEKLQLLIKEAESSNQ